MTANSITKKIMIAGVALVTLGGAFAATTTTASAGYYKPGYGYGYKKYGYGNKKWVYGGAAVAGALALGAIAASSAYAPACYTVRRPVEDDWGNVYMQRVRVCD